MPTRRTAYVTVNLPLPEGGAVTADLYVLWPQGTPHEAVQAALDHAVAELRDQVVHRAS